MYAHMTTWSLRSSTHVKTWRHWSALNPVAAEAEIDRTGALAGHPGKWQVSGSVRDPVLNKNNKVKSERYLISTSGLHVHTFICTHAHMCTHCMYTHIHTCTHKVSFDTTALRCLLCLLHVNHHSLVQALWIQEMHVLHACPGTWCGMSLMTVEWMWSLPAHYSLTPALMRASADTFRG